MALDDLDLEFEDEDETNKKANEKLGGDIPLEFTMAETPKPVPPPARPQIVPQPVPQTTPVAAKPTAPMGTVKKIDEARANGAASEAPRRPVAMSSAPARTSGSSALKASPAGEFQGDYDYQSQEIIELRERARVAEFNAEVKVQVADYKIELLGELLGDTKLMDHQVNQLLNRIYAKHPDTKQEVLLIKKILADFTAKKRR